MKLTQRSAPTALPVTQAEILAHLRIADTNPPDLADILRIARGAVAELDGPQGSLRRALAPQAWSLWLDCFPPCIRVPLPPLIAVEAIRYLDSNNDWQTLATDKYRVIDGGEDRSEIIPAYGETWPSTANTLSSVEIRFIAGYADGSPAVVAVPDDIKNALLEMTAVRFACRDGTMFSSDRILDDLPACRALQRYKVYA